MPEASAARRRPFPASSRCKRRCGEDWSTTWAGWARPKPMRQAHSQTIVAKSALLPNLSGDVAETVETVNLQALGISLQPIGSGLYVSDFGGAIQYARCAGAGIAKRRGLDRTQQLSILERNAAR